jgi:hypothetical protein
MDNRYNIILSRFKSQFWFDRNLSFGMHERYLYTLPFHFDDLYTRFEDFYHVKSNNPEILINNCRIWYYVKSIEMSSKFKYDVDFVKEIKN